MKRYLPIILSTLLFFFSFTLVKAQDFNFDRAYNDYLYNYNLYRENYRAYLNAKETYLKHRTLTSKTEALKKTKQMLINQDEVIKTYLTALRLKLMENQGLSPEEKNILFSSLDKEIDWFRQHQEEINNTDNLEDLTIIAEKSKKQYESTEILIYQTLGTILAGKETTLR